MKSFVAVTFLALFATTAAAHQNPLDQGAQFRKGTRNMWIGVALVGVGLIVAPVTAVNPHDTTHSAAVATGVGLVAAGSVMVWVGAGERRKASQPETTFGVFLGKNNGVQIRRLW